MKHRLCISADSHVVEPESFFDPIVKKFGDDAPRMVVENPNMGPQVLVGPGDIGASAAGFLQVGVDFSKPEAQEQMKHGYALARPGCWDPNARMLDMDEDEVNAEVLYPSLMFSLFRMKKPEVLNYTFHLYNDWIADHCKGHRDRMFPLGCVNIVDIESAIKELHRCKRLGHVGVCVAATAPPERPYSHPDYDRFWATAQDLGMSLSMHMLTGATRWHAMPFEPADNQLAFAGVMFTIHDLIWSGVCERFPSLKFVITEFETGWIAIMLKRMDWLYLRRGGARNYGLPLKPSDYWRRQFYATFEDDPLGILTRDHIGTNTLMWGSDYPHGDSIFPKSQAILSEVLSACSPQEVFEMTVKNVVELYDLPFKLETPQQSSIVAKQSLLSLPKQSGGRAQSRDFS